MCIRLIGTLFSLLSFCCVHLTAQTLYVEYTPDFNFSSSRTTSLYTDHHAGLWKVTVGDKQLQLARHNGRAWIPYRPEGENILKVIRSLSRELVVETQQGLLAYSISTKDVVERRLLADRDSWNGELRQVSVNHLGTSFLETTQGIYACTDGNCALVLSGAYQLLGSSGQVAACQGQDGRIYVLSAAECKQVDAIPAQARSVTQPASAVSYFVAAGQVYQLRFVAKDAELTTVGRIDEQAQLAVLANKLLAIQPEHQILEADLKQFSGWKPLGASRGREFGEQGYVSSEQGQFVNVFNRVVATTTTGVISIGQSPYLEVDTKLSHSEKPVFAITDSLLLLTMSEGLQMTNRAESSRVGSTIFTAEDNLMRFSVPTTPAFYREQPVVGTSDGRVLHLSPTEDAELLVDLRGYGGYVYDLQEIDGELWGTFDPTPYKNSGIFRYSPDGGLQVYTDSMGLGDHALSVRKSPDGRIFASTKNTTTPLYAFIAHENLWVPLGANAFSGRHKEDIDAYEVAAVADTLIYLATSEGLLEFRPATGYKIVDLPINLRGKKVTSVLADQGGIWFSVSGAGIYFYRGENILEITGSEVWPSKSFGFRSLKKTEAGDCFANDGSKLYQLIVPREFGQFIDPIVRIGQQRDQRLGSFAAEDRALSFSGQDSLFIRYSVPGFSTAKLTASISIGGEEIQPVAQAPGFLAFAPMGVRSGPFQLRILPADQHQQVASLKTQIRFLAPWYVTPEGIAFFVVLGILCTIMLGYGIVLRQKRNALRLEALVATRTADLVEAQRKAERASAAKTMFLANMSHEIRTPLNAVLGMAELIGDDRLSPEQTEYLKNIKQAGNSLHNIVGDVLDFAQLENGATTKLDVSTDIQELLFELLQQTADAAFAKGLFFGSDLQLPKHLVVDGRKLKSILRHLLENGVKFTENGTLNFKGYLRKDSDSGQLSLHFEIQDTGIGIAEDQLDSIFEVFHQVDNSNTRKYGGTGLGLAIVKTYTACMGGQLHVASRPNEGSSFKLHIPLVEQTIPEPQANRPLGKQKQQAYLLCEHSGLAWTLQREFGRQAVEVTTRTTPDFNLPLVIGITSVEDYQQLRQSGAYANFHKRMTSTLFVGPRAVLTKVDLPEGAPTLAYPFREADLMTAIRAFEPARKRIDPKTFDVTRPAVRIPLPQPSKAPARRPNASPATDSLFFDLAKDHPLSILIAEDNPMNKMLCLTVLKKLGYTADWAENGKVAVEKFADGEYDLILMDVHMPEMDGLDATRIIRKQYFEQPVHICALTANASEEGRVECIDAGMDSFLSKPLQVQSLINLLKSVETVEQKMAAGLAEVIAHYRPKH